jgi:membrane associated rhomboid family serine protease
MGIYDREYYRRDGPSFLGSFAGQGKVCKWLIVINVAVFVVQLTSPKVTGWIDLRTGITLSDEKIARELGPELRGLSPEDRQEIIQEEREKLGGGGVLQGQVWRLLTYAFAHDPGSIWHIVFNMLFLWWFGHEMEEMYGSREFLIFYLTSALLGGLAYFLWSWARDYPVPCVGASGAVTAAMVLYAFHFPRRVIYIWFVLPIPIWLFVGFQVAQDTLSFFGGQQTTTAVTVHLAGAAFAFGYYKLNWRLAPWWDAARQLRLPGPRPRLRVYEEEHPPRPVRPAARASAPAAEADEHLEAKVDAVLEKVARHGRDSLTESEKELLVRASEVYKRKRS